MASKLVLKCPKCLDVVFESKFGSYQYMERMTSENTIYPQGHMPTDVLGCKKCLKILSDKYVYESTNWEITGMPKGKGFK